MRFTLLVLCVVSILFFSGCVNEKEKEKNKKLNKIEFEQKETSAEGSAGKTKDNPKNLKQSISMKYTEEQIVSVKTNLGKIKLKLYTPDAPRTVNNFLKLAESGFYDETLFHRVIENFMIQGGDPLSKKDDKSKYGTGGPGYTFKDEINKHKLVRGSLAMANSGPNTNGSQFFIVTAEKTPWLDGKHTNFGQVVKGMEIVDKVEAVETDSRDCPVKAVKIEEIDLIEPI